MPGPRAINAAPARAAASAPGSGGGAGRGRGARRGWSRSPGAAPSPGARLSSPRAWRLPAALARLQPPPPPLPRLLRAAGIQRSVLRLQTPRSVRCPSRFSSWDLRCACAAVPRSARARAKCPGRARRWSAAGLRALVGAARGDARVHHFLPA